MRLWRRISASSARMSPARVRVTSSPSLSCSMLACSAVFMAIRCTQVRSRSGARSIIHPARLALPQGPLAQVEHGTLARMGGHGLELQPLRLLAAPRNYDRAQHSCKEGGFRFHAQWMMPDAFA